jgi:hypothetical protein
LSPGKSGTTRLRQAAKREFVYKITLIAWQLGFDFFSERGRINPLKACLASTFFKKNSLNPNPPDKNYVVELRWRLKGHVAYLRTEGKGQTLNVTKEPP